VSIHCFSAILKRRIFSPIRISVLLKDSVYFTVWYSYISIAYITDFDLESKVLGDELLIVSMILSSTYLRQFRLFIILSPFQRLVPSLLPSLTNYNFLFIYNNNLKF